MRIAVARAEGVDENAHFGYAERFLVFELADGGNGEDVEPILLEERAANGHCTGAGGDRRLLRGTVALVADCTAVIALRIGPCARRDLDAAGVLPLEHPGPGLDGAGALIAGLRRRRLLQLRRQERQKESSR
jgi:predicted Fe-Mo cluster-binding NifX family protein